MQLYRLLFTSSMYVHSSTTSVFTQALSINKSIQCNKNKPTYSSYAVSPRTSISTNRSPVTCSSSRALLVKIAKTNKWFVPFMFLLMLMR